MGEWENRNIPDGPSEEDRVQTAAISHLLQRRYHLREAVRVAEAAPVALPKLRDSLVRVERMLVEAGYVDPPAVMLGGAGAQLPVTPTTHTAAEQVASSKRAQEASDRRAGLAEVMAPDGPQAGGQPAGEGPPRGGGQVVDVEIGTGATL